MAKDKYEIYVQTEVVSEEDPDHITHDLKSVEVLPSVSSRKAYEICKSLVEHFDDAMSHGSIGPGAIEATGVKSTKVTAIGMTEKGDTINTVFELFSTDYTVDSDNRLEIIGTPAQIEERVIAVRALVAHALSPSGNAIAPLQ